MLPGEPEVTSLGRGAQVATQKVDWFCTQNVQHVVEISNGKLSKTLFYLYNYTFAHINDTVAARLIAPTLHHHDRTAKRNNPTTFSSTSICFVAMLRVRIPRNMISPRTRTS